MPLTYPPAVTTVPEKFAYLLFTQERLRLVHNFVGYWYNPTTPDLTQAQYDTGLDGGLIGGDAGSVVVLPDSLKALQTYRPKLTEQRWDQFRLVWFTPRHEAVSAEYMAMKVALRKALTYLFDPDHLI